MTHQYLLHHLFSKGEGYNPMNKNETFIRFLFTHYYSILTFKMDYDKQEKGNLYMVLCRKDAVLYIHLLS